MHLVLIFNLVIGIILTTAGLMTHNDALKMSCLNTKIIQSTLGTITIGSTLIVSSITMFYCRKMCTGYTKEIYGNAYEAAIVILGIMLITFGSTIISEFSSNTCKAVVNPQPPTLVLNIGIMLIVGYTIKMFVASYKQQNVLFKE